jgi:hypothetical protein
LKRAILSHEASKQNELNNIKNYNRWKERFVENYQKAIRQQQIQSLLNNFLDNTVHCDSAGVNLAVEHLNSIFDLSSSLSNQKYSSRQAKKMNNNGKWFDEECKTLRKELNNLSNQKHRDTENLSTHLHNGESLKHYRNTLWKKKEQHVRNQINVNEESTDSNHFWENGKTLSNNNTKSYLSKMEMYG